MKSSLLVLGLLFSGCSSQFNATSPTGSAPSANDVAPSGKTLLSGTVTLDPKLSGRVAPGDIVYIIAKSEQGGPPLAVKKTIVTAFPMQFELQEGDAMIPGRPLAGEVIVVFRVDKDGMAGPPQPGDLEGKTLKPVKIGNQTVAIKIDKSY